MFPVTEEEKIAIRNSMRNRKQLECLSESKLSGTSSPLKNIELFDQVRCRRIVQCSTIGNGAVKHQDWWKILTYNREPPDRFIRKQSEVVTHTRGKSSCERLWRVTSSQGTIGVEGVSSGRTINRRRNAAMLSGLEDSQLSWRRPLLASQIVPMSERRTSEQRGSCRVLPESSTDKTVQTQQSPSTKEVEASQVKKGEKEEIGLENNFGSRSQLTEAVVEVEKTSSLSSSSEYHSTVVDPFEAKAKNQHES